jgi:hypothetical protein
MVVAGRNAIALVTACAIFGLVYGKPFLPPWWSSNARDLSCMALVIGACLLLLYNKLVCGVFFPGAPKNKVADRDRS